MKHRYNSAPSTKGLGKVLWDSSTLGTNTREDGERRARKRFIKRIREALNTVKLAPTRKPKDRKPSPPSWPNSPDQRAQSRPPIIVRPVRAMRILLDRQAREMGIEGGLKQSDVTALYWGGSIHPKHFLDCSVLSF